MRIPKRIYLIYILFISTVALLSVGGQILIQREINNHIDDSQVINRAGRQRFQSQQIVKAIVILINNPDAKHRKAYLQELKTALTSWQKYHQQLQNGQMPGLDSELQNSAQIKQMFQELNPHYEVIHQRALQMVQQLENPTGAVGQDSQAILQEILNHEPLFLSQMDAIVFQYDREAKEKVRTLRLTEFVLVSLTLLALFLEWQFVFQPAIIQLRKSIQLQQKINEGLQEANEALQDQTHFIEKVTTTLPSRILIVDTQTLRLVYANKKSEQSVGYSNAEMQEQGLPLLKPLFHPEDYDNYAQFFRDFVTASEGEMRETECRTMHLDGFYHHFLFRGTVFHRNEAGIPDQVIGILQDITPLKQTEAELQKTVSLLKENQEEVQATNEELTASIEELKEVNEILDEKNLLIEKVFNTIPSMIYIYDLTQSKGIFFSREIAPMVGYSLNNAQMAEEEILKKISTDETRAKRQQFYQSFVTANDNVVREMESQLITADGSEQYFLIRGTVFHRNEAGIPDQIVAVSQDITLKKQTEVALQNTLNNLQATNEELTQTEEQLHELNNELENRVGQRTSELAESNARFELLARSTNDVIWDWNLITQEIWWNESFQILFGYRPEQIEPNLESWSKRIHPDDQKRVLNGIHWVIDNGDKQWSDEYRFCRADGSYAYIFDRGYVLHTEEGKPYRMIGSMLDLTERKQAEKQLKALTEKLVESHERYELVAQATNDAIWEWFYGREFIHWNHAFRDLFGYLSEEEKQFSTLTTWQERIHPDDRDQIILLREQSLQNQQTAWQASYRFRRANGTYAYVLDQALILYDNHHQPYRLVGSLMDISPLKEAEKSLQKRNQELQKINRDMDNFIYVSSHDLKHPIVNLEGLLEVLQMHLQRTPDEETSRWVSLMEVSVTRLKKTILEIANISKIQKGLEEPHEMLGFKSVWQEAMADTTDLITWADATIRTDFRQKTIFYSKNNLRTILYNLLSNALKYHSSERPTEIKVTTFIHKRQLILTVSDNGLGLDQTQQAKLFTMFKRLHSHVEGTGIGLYMTRRIIENNGGKITVKSELGVGSTFTVIFDNQALPSEIAE